MTDFNKYKNASFSKKAHNKLVLLSTILFPGLKLSISKTIEVLVNKEIKKIEEKSDANRII